MSESAIGTDGLARCSWAVSEPEATYHDTEWGFPVDDDVRLFEKICLEGFQSGLSWRTILVKRENFRSAFAGFDFEIVSQFDSRDVERLLGDAGIVRHRGKIEAVIANAARAIELSEREGSLARFFWRYEGGDPSALSKELKARGWRFVGPTTAYAFMQAMGLVNDHDQECHTHADVARARLAFDPPT
ncbi:MAG: DNA-3-methyladenine glycosylase I [Solirubrobacterales bacterium]